MTKILRFQRRYFILTVLLFLIEVYIAKYVHDDIIRPYIGDFLVVMLLYCFLRAFTRISELTSCILVLIFSFLIEILQYVQWVRILGLQDSNIATTVMGNSFAWMDLMMYTAGIISILFIEWVWTPRNNKKYPGR